MSRARAFLFPQEEDFGILAVEALAAGTPVIAYSVSGAREIVEDGVSGRLVAEQTIDAFADALRSFTPEAFPVETTRARAEQFSQKVFQEGMQSVIEETLATR